MARIRAINLRAAPVPTANRKADFKHGSDQNQKQKQKQSEKQTQSQQQQKQRQSAELSCPTEKSSSLLEQIEQIRGETGAQTHPIEPTQLKFRWISATLGKLKGPATATGAALLAVAGGLAASRARNGNGRQRKLVKSLKRIDLPSADAAIDWVEKRATDVGDAADKAEQMTSTARKVKKALS